uniref:Uncharacterized protein n=1 Tax=Glossina morsitans morsitans TaxID=37546 RepID=A0A1B0FK47_GLOMM
MTRREAWSADKPADARTKSTCWKFHNGRKQFDENMGGGPGLHATTEQPARPRWKASNSRAVKEDTHFSFHNSRINLINDLDIYIEDVIDEQQLVDEEAESFRRSKHNKQQMVQQQQQQQHQIDDDSMQRHEIDRGSDIDYNTTRSSLRNKREFFIKRYYN